MALTDGLIWPSGDNGWKKIPTGPGYVPPNFNANATTVQLRCVKGNGAVAGAPGPIVDFTSPDQLETANPPRDGKPVVLWSGAHPTDLKVALIVWSCPVVILDKSKFNVTGNVSVNGRVMTVELLDGVDIDGGNAQTVTIHQGGVGGYGTITDNGNLGQGVVAADTGNDTTDNATDKKSPTDGQQIPAFYVNDDTTLNIICVYQFEMVNCLHCSAVPHKAWGICWCLWGSTAPLDLFSFGSFLSVSPSNLQPHAQRHYAGAVTRFANRSQIVPVSIVGVSGPAVTVNACLESGVALQQGEFVSFDDYECQTLCGNPGMTKVNRDEAIPFVDEDIIKPALRTLPLAFLTTGVSLKATTIPNIQLSTFQPFQTSTFFYNAVPFYSSSLLMTLPTWNNPPAIPIGTSVVLTDVNVGLRTVKVFNDATPFLTEVVSTIDLVVCLPGGGNTTLHLLALPSAGSVTVVTDIVTSPVGIVSGLTDITFFNQTSSAPFTSVIATIPTGITNITPIMLAGATPIVLGTPIGPQIPFSVAASGTQSVFVPDPSGTVKTLGLVTTSSPTDDMIQVLTVRSTDKLRKTGTTVAAPGTCQTTPNPAIVVPSDDGLYESATEIVMLKPIIVEKNPGNEQSCPCFLGPDGGPQAKPGSIDDGANSEGIYNPCTIKVRRLQHRRCLTSS